MIRRMEAADLDAAAEGTASSSRTTQVEYGGRQFTVTCSNSNTSLPTAGNSWVESTQPGLAWELYSDSLNQLTTVVRAPADYDGVLLGLNVVDDLGSNPGTQGHNLDLSTQNTSHYIFIRLSYGT